MTDRDQRIREIAYFLWLEEGSPEGEADRHWRAAEGLIEDEPLDGEPAASETPDKPKKPSTATAVSD